MINWSLVKIIIGIPGIEPDHVLYKNTMLPLHHTPINVILMKSIGVKLIGIHGIKPCPWTCRVHVLSLHHIPFHDLYDEMKNISWDTWSRTMSSWLWAKRAIHYTISQVIIYNHNMAKSIGIHGIEPCLQGCNPYVLTITLYPRLSFEW